MGNLPEALPVLLEETVDDPGNSWLLYRLAWVYNRMEQPEEALVPALAAWRTEPEKQWYLAEYLRALRNLSMFEELLAHTAYVRGGGVCRYYLAVAEREMNIHPSASLEYFHETSASDDDSTAADACIWLAILLQNEVSGDSIINLASDAVEKAPSSEFYRCVLAENLARNGMVEQAREQIHWMRLEGYAGYSYWQACAELAEAEEDDERRIWALRRARQNRNCPDTARNLGWALYISGRDALRNGDLVYSRERLQDALQTGDSTEVCVMKSDSLLNLINEFENRAALID